MKVRHNILLTRTTVSVERFFCKICFTRSKGISDIFSNIFVSILLYAFF